MKRILSLCCLAGLSAAAMASVKFNEIMINSPGADQGQEWIELKSTSANENLSNLTLIVIEGDFSAAGQQGIITTVQTLSGTTGSNSLALIRDTATQLLPAPNPATTIIVNDWTPDIQNGTQTYLLVRGFTGAINQDIDANNDGILDVTPWTSVDSAIGYTDGSNAGDVMYGAQVGGLDFPVVGFSPAGYELLPGNVHSVLAVTEPTGSTTGPYTAVANLFKDSAANLLTPSATWTMTPGSDNMSLVSFLNPTSYAVIDGLNFGGSLASLFGSDDDKVVVLCDENTPNGKVQIDVNGLTSVSSLNLLVETSASRNDIGQWVYLRNATTTANVQMDFRLTSFADTAFTAPVANPADYLGGGQITAFVVWIPTQDIDAGDGWTCSIDRFQFDLVP